MMSVRRLDNLQQPVEIGITELDLIEGRIEFFCDAADIIAEAAGEEQPRQPLQAEQAVRRGWDIDPSPRQARADKQSILFERRDLGPAAVSYTHLTLPTILRV